ncbi:MAG: hypothetical protein A2681_00915 [Candidatus Liptonbacteria bacterium RIFCSPHIGHO2_01_FULL_56_18b]|nr:MAG: hypothetical protein A2681_00915 [Candidatus Liptonbacteria bacterium RIFCSPHIGHO2_01_FULL_56_18b]
MGDMLPSYGIRFPLAIPWGNKKTARGGRGERHKAKIPVFLYRNLAFLWFPQDGGFRVVWGLIPQFFNMVPSAVSPQTYRDMWDL